MNATSRPSCLSVENRPNLRPFPGPHRVLSGDQIFVNLLFDAVLRQRPFSES